MLDDGPRHLAAEEPSGRRGRWPMALGAVLLVGMAAAAAQRAGWGTEQEATGAASPGLASTALPTSTTLATTTTTTAPPRAATLLFGGDVLIHSPVWQAAATADGFDFSALLEPIAAQVTAADVALCHLEVTLGREGEPLSSYPRFRAPAALATDLAEAGFDGCSVASNHSLDFGASGVVATLDAMDAAGLRHVGTARSPEEDRLAASYDAGGIRVAHLSYTYGFNGFRRPVGEEWVADLIDPALILSDARAARLTGAELVVVSLHWGDEYRHEVSEAQRQVAEALAAEPGVVDLVVGSHAHVVQPIAKVGDLWVIWGMGNLLSNNSPGCCLAEATDGVLVTVAIGDLAPGRGTVGVTGITFTPTWNERQTFRVLPAAAALRLGVEDPELAADLRESFLRTADHVQRLGGADLGVAPDQLPP